MSKIICDVCGTSFADTANQCPICGCVRSADAKMMIADPDERENTGNGTYTHVKGGRFSKANVKKRSAPNTSSQEPLDEPSEKKPKMKSDRGLVIAVLALLLAIVAVAIYIVCSFIFLNDDKPDDSGKKTSQTSQKQENDKDDNLPEKEENEDPVEEKIPCTGLTLSADNIELTDEKMTERLTVTVTPADSNEEVTFESDTPAVAIVDEDGIITAIATGTANITVKCGDQTQICNVVCNIENMQTETTNPDDTTGNETDTETDDEPADATSNYTFNTYNGGNDLSLLLNESFELKVFDENNEEIEVVFTTAANAICTVTDGNIVTLTNYNSINDYSVITAQHGDDIIKCTVRPRV